MSSSMIDASLSVGVRVPELGVGSVPQLSNYLSYSRGVLTTNAVAFAAFAANWVIADKIDGDVRHRWMTNVIMGCARSLGGTGSTYELLASRSFGFASAAPYLDHDSLILAKYFEACCCAGSVAVDLSQISEHPDDLEFLAATFGPTPDLNEKRKRAKLALARSTVYRSNLFVLQGTAQTLMTLAETVRTYVLDRTRGLA